MGTHSHRNRIRSHHASRLDTIQAGFLDDRCAANDDITTFWTYGDSLKVTDGVILYRDRVVVPPSLRDKALRTPSQAAMPAIPSPVPFNHVRMNIRRLLFDFAGCHLWLETDYPDGSRSSKLLMGQHNPVLRA